MTSKKYNVLDLETGSLDRRIFVDQQIYDEEMDKIFGRTWLLVAHDSLVPNPNDFFLSYMGESPVIVTRDPERKLHVLLNMCRHRGNRVIRADDGNTRNFLCTYHGWQYCNKGKLNHVPGEQEAYANRLPKAELGLVEARVETYAGLIFACWDHGAPSLEAYLGDARWYLDITFNRTPEPMVALGPQKWVEPCNWKVPVDNCSDNYHVPITHYSTLKVAAKARGTPPPSMADQLKEPNPSHHLFINGHSVTFKVRDPSAPRPIRRGITPENKAAFDRWDDEADRLAVRQLGAERSKIAFTNQSIFPNTVLGMRLAHPRGPHKTEFWHFALVPRDAPEEIRRVTQNASSQYNGAGGMLEQDDVDNWRQVTDAGLMSIGRKYPANLSMGVGQTQDHEQWPGVHARKFISEHNQRQFYLRWQELMNADSWADIRIEPMTATYEGEARFNAGSPR